VSEKNLVPAVQGTTIVIVGDFNPAIMHPLWFSNNNLISEEDAKAADTELVHKQVSKFRTKSVLIQVTIDRFLIQTEDPTMFLPLRDLALGTFSILEHTPLRAFGVNRYELFHMRTLKEWHALGDLYTPKTIWKEIMDGPGMKQVTIQGQRANVKDARIEFTLQPIDMATFGVQLRLNEHYDVPTSENSQETIAFFLSTLHGMWDGFESYWQSASTLILNAPAVK